MRSSSPGSHPEFSPCRASKVNKIGFLDLLIGHDSGKSDGVYRTDIHAGLCPAGATSLAKKRSVSTEVTLLGFLGHVIPLHALRSKRTGFNTRLAANAELLVDHPNVAVFRMWTVSLDGLYGTGVNAGCLLTLPTGGHKDVIRPVPERVLLDLNTSKAVGGLTFVS